MKKVFKFALVAFMAAAVAVSCKDDPKPTPEPEPQPEPQPEYTGPVQGESAWSVIGTVLETNWDTDYVLAEADGIFVLKNLKLAAGNEFKIRENKGWDNNRGGDFAELGAGFDVTNGGANIKPELDGIYDVYYNPALEQMAVCEKDAAPAWSEPSFVPAVTIDGNFDEWGDAEAITGINNRIVEWKYLSDEKFVYFMYKITKGKIKFDASSGYDWKSYIYIGFDTDNDAATGKAGENGGCGDGLEALALVFPWRGMTEGSPEIFIGEDGNGKVECPVGTATGAHVTTAGKFDGDYCFLEVSIERAKIGSPAAGKITVNSAMDYYKTDRHEITLN